MPISLFFTAGGQLSGFALNMGHHTPSSEVMVRNNVWVVCCYFFFFLFPVLLLMCSFINITLQDVILLEYISTLTFFFPH